MKRFAIISTLAAAGAFAASAGEMAAFADIDTNEDGVVTEAEFISYKTADGSMTDMEAADKFIQVDANADGTVTEDELTAAKEEWKDKDANADVEVDVETDSTY